MQPPQVDPSAATSKKGNDEQRRMVLGLIDPTASSPLDIADTDVYVPAIRSPTEYDGRNWSVRGEDPHPNYGLNFHFVVSGLSLDKVNISGRHGH